ncbi:MAG: Gfo/Idh/MocA family oxidoreductase [Acidobacteriota bacterium]
MKDWVGIGIIGTGFARTVQIPAFAACEKARTVSVASASIENARSTANAFEIEQFTDDWRDTIRNEEVDLICITTPPIYHREMALAAMEQGKHVLCEKPMAMNVAEAEEIADAARSAGVLALIDHELRFQQGRQEAYVMLRLGEIGKVRHAKYLFQAPHRGNPEIPWNWWSDIESGGGALGAINSHIIDSFQWFLGADVSSVFCQLQTHVKQRKDPDGNWRDVTTDDQANMILRFADSEVASDATGLVSVSMTEGPKYMNRLEFFGEDGAMRITHRGEVFVAKTGDKEWRQIEVELNANIDGVPDTGFARGFMAFAPAIVDAILEGRNEIEYAATFDDGARVQRVLDAARESNRTGRSTQI